MDDHLKGIATFVHAVEAGNFTAAAQRLRLTRSAVAKSIARLEERLGVRLFQRTTRQQRLTENGQAFYERCKRALAEIDAAQAALDATGREPMGRLRVTAPVIFGRHCVAPVLSRLVHRHPRLDVEISFSDRVVDLVQEGFDLAVRFGELGDSASLAARRLGVQQFVICAAPGYLARHGTPRSIPDFSDHLGIVYAGSGPETPWQVRDVNGRMQELRIARRIRFDDLQAIADAAVAGMGLARLPHWLAAPHLRAGELVVLMHNEHVLATDIHVVWSHTRAMSSRMRVAIDALVAEVPQLMELRSRPLS